MKATLIFRYVLAFYLITCFSCSKDSTEEDVGINYGTVQLKINGSSILLRPLGPVREIHSDGSFSIGGIKCNDYDSYDLIIHFPPEVGIYSLGEEELPSATIRIGDFFPCIGLFEDGSGYKTYAAIEGALTISELSNQRVIGTFHFMGEGYGEEVLTVTDGVFNVLRE